MWTLLVANRGEIACRVMRSARELGLRCVAVFEPADATARHVRAADAAVPVASYLDVGGVVAAARDAGADALHPGYGFLSENPALARACAAAGITWVGPSADVIELLGDKTRAKAAAAAAGVTVVPEVDLAAPAFPLMVKAAAGGGGRGMRVVEAAEELDAALAAARREALAAFGSDAVFAERFVPRGRHVEVQVLGDAHGTVVHLGARDCTLQRRHQKVVEEASSTVPEALCAEAVALARAVGYVNAGTVEFIVDAATGECFFLEMNTRLQVEHPVTEAVWGVDLVALQLRVAMGEAVPAPGPPAGHAVEVRVTAEDVAGGFLPAAGRIAHWTTPEGAAAFGPAPARGVRVDAGYGAGDVVGTAYDSLLAKVVVHAPTRAEALRRTRRALADTTILGVRTNLGFLRALLAVPEVVADTTDTGLIERLPSLAPAVSDEDAATVAALARLAALPDGTLWDRRDGWRLGGVRGASHWRFAVDGRAPVDVALPGGTVPGLDTPWGAQDPARSPSPTDDPRWRTAVDGDDVWLALDGWPSHARAPAPEENAAGATEADVRAPMPGQVLLVHAADGALVAAGDPLLVLESMKMELTLQAPADGTVNGLVVAPGDRVTEGQLLACVEPAGVPA